jgi:LysM repeat protein
MSPGGVVLTNRGELLMKVRHLYANHRIILVAILAVLTIFLLTAATTKAAPEQSCGFSIQVQRGQTLGQISRQYGVSIQALMQANPQIRNPNMIFAGSWVFIPCAPQTPADRCSNIHYVQRGQTLSQIAWRYGVSVQSIMRVNGIQNPNIIYAGTGLCIPNW